MTATRGGGDEAEAAAEVAEAEVVVKCWWRQR